MSRRSKELKNYCSKVQGHKCYWCGRKIYPYEGWDRSEQFPDDYATVDHIFTMKDSRRKHFKKIKKPSPFVMSCRACNQKRGSMLVEQMEKLCHKKHIDWNSHFTTGKFFVVQQENYE